jgi:3-oxoacyl-[acyl-carrier protein] reductase
MQRVFSLNTFSTMLLSSLFLPLLERGTNPCIVNVTSIAARNGAPTATVYGAAEGAIDSFTRGVAAELAPKIRVNAVAPGVIDTPFHERYSTPTRMEKFRENTPLKHHGKAIHVARTILFLIENDFITGETIDVNGGLFMR